MIAILLNDASFEQDIRELLMAFYPGETFTHKEEEAGEAELIVRGVRDGNSFSLDVTPVKKEAVHFALIYPDFSNRFETKNEIKQTLYRLLSAQTGRELPWGTLTGIRPTKIALTKLYDGWTDEQIETYMRETYFTSKEKIDLSIDVAERVQPVCGNPVLSDDLPVLFVYVVSDCEMGKTDGPLQRGAF